MYQMIWEHSAIAAAVTLKLQVVALLQMLLQPLKN
jgi:hypothetical protein